jgi:hypothetical protein
MFLGEVLLLGLLGIKKSVICKNCGWHPMYPTAYRRTYHCVYGIVCIIILSQPTTSVF